MNRPPHPHMIGNLYCNPRPYNNQWRPRGARTHPGHQWRPNTHYRPTTNSINDEHWCETCDRGFPTADLLNGHKQQHQKCNIDGCQFVAHPKVITKHIQMQHSSGLYKKIAKLNNPEEIQKWREERKKKYPTRVNIEKKEAACKEKIDRGEKMALKRNKNEIHKSTEQVAGIKRRHSFDKRSQSYKNNRPNFNQQQYTSHNKRDQPQAKKIPKIIPKVPSVVENNKLKPFTGILSICMDDDKIEEKCNTSNGTHNLIEDDYYEEPVQNLIEKPTQDPVLCGALSSLMCDYRSSDEETNEKDNMLSHGTEFMKSVAKDNFKKVAETVNNDDTKECVINVNTQDIKDVQTVLGDNLKIDVTQTNDMKQNVEENSDNDSGPEEVKNVKSNIPDLNPSKEQITKNKEPSQIHVKRNIPSRNDHRINTYKPKVPSTLLQKLLYKEIRQERNIVLQCIRHIKKMNYFDKIEE